MYCSGECASQIGEFINNLKSLAIHSDGWFALLLFKCWLAYYLSHFVTVRSKLLHASETRSIAPGIFVSVLALSANSSA